MKKLILLLVALSILLAVPSVFAGKKYKIGSQECEWNVQWQRYDCYDKPSRPEYKSGGCFIDTVMDN